MSVQPRDLEALVRMLNLKLQGVDPLVLEVAPLPRMDARLTGRVVTRWMDWGEAVNLLRFAIGALDTRRELDVAASRVPDSDEEEPDQFGHGKEDDHDS